MLYIYIVEYDNYSVCLSYIMLYIPSYRCNVACSTMCTERLVRLTIERYVLLVAHIIRRCTTCSIEKFSSYNCQGIKTIVHTLNYYTRIPSPCFLLYFSRNFLSFFIVLIPAAWNEDSFPKAKRNWNSAVYIYLFLEEKRRSRWRRSS